MRFRLRDVEPFNMPDAVPNDLAGHFLSLFSGQEECDFPGERMPLSVCLTTVEMASPRSGVGKGLLLDIDIDTYEVLSIKEADSSGEYDCHRIMKQHCGGLLLLRAEAGGRTSIEAHPVELAKPDVSDAEAFRVESGGFLYTATSDVEYLMSELESGLTRERGQDRTIGAIRRLSDLSAMQALPLLRRALLHSNVTVKTDAALAMYRLGDPAGVKALASFRADPETAEAAGRNLEKIDEREVARWLGPRGEASVQPSPDSGGCSSVQEAAPGLPEVLLNEFKTSGRDLEFAQSRTREWMASRESFSKAGILRG